MNGHLVFKCRLCGEIVQADDDVPDMLTAIRCIDRGMPLPTEMEWATIGPAVTVESHQCSDKMTGTVELVGAVAASGSGAYMKFDRQPAQLAQTAGG